MKPSASSRSEASKAPEGAERSASADTPSAAVVAMVLAVVALAIGGTVWAVVVGQEDQSSGDDYTADVQTESADGGLDDEGTDISDYPSSGTAENDEGPGSLKYSSDSELQFAAEDHTCAELKIWYDVNPGDSNLNIARQFFIMCDGEIPPPVASGEISDADEFFGY